MASRGMAQGIGRGIGISAAAAPPDPHGRLPVPVALLVIGGLSAGLWLGIFRLVAALL